MHRLYPADRRVLRTIRPVLSHMAGLPLPPDAVFAAAERLSTELADVRAMLIDPTLTSVRLVLTPESVVIAEARRTLTSLSLYGYRVDGVVANRVFPADGPDDWRAGWIAAQREQLAAVRTSFAEVPIWESGYAASEPLGLAALAALAEATYQDTDPLGFVSTPEPLSVERVSSDEFVMSIGLPHADRREVELIRKGNDLVVTVGSYRRALALPSALQRCVVDGAGLRDGRLRVRFRVDDAVWIRS
jgi:arsenite-transporting ATPase